MRQGALGLIGVGVGVVLAFACPAAAGADAGQLKAGVAVVDATWHVGRLGGPVRDDARRRRRRPVRRLRPAALHSYKNKPSYGVQSRLEARALVVEEADGQRLALVKNDLYIPQDLL